MEKDFVLAMYYKGLQLSFVKAWVDLKFDVCIIIVFVYVVVMTVL